MANHNNDNLVSIKVPHKLEIMIDAENSNLAEEIAQKVIEKACLAIEHDAKAVCPVDTGNLRASIHTRIMPLQGEVGTPVDYAPFVEFGTSRQHAQPFMETAFLQNIDRIEEEFKRRLDEL